MKELLVISKSCFLTTLVWSSVNAKENSIYSCNHIFLFSNSWHAFIWPIRKFVSSCLKSCVRYALYKYEKWISEEKIQKLNGDRIECITHRGMKSFSVCTLIDFFLLFVSIEVSCSCPCFYIPVPLPLPLSLYSFSILLL